MAYKKPSTQSSTYSDIYRNEAQHTNDGDPSTGSVTKYSGPGWWQVDLQQLIKIDRIQLHLNQHALTNGYYKDLIIETRTQENDAFVLCVKLGVPTTLQKTLTCSSSTIARYVRVHNPKGNILYLQEVEVYGSVISDTDKGKACFDIHYWLKKSTFQEVGNFSAYIKKQKSLIYDI